MWALAGGSDAVAYPSLSLYGHSLSPTAFYDVRSGGNSWCDGIAQATCATETQEETSVTGNPNDLSLGGVNLGTLDCAFKRDTASTTPVANAHQCNAAAGFDGPSGLGTPNGLGVFKPSTPKAKVHLKGTAHAKSKARFSIRGSDPFPGAKWASAVWTWGDGHKSKGVAPTHTYKHKGHFTVTVTAIDSYGRPAATAKARITVHKKK
jgi:hypothetical protein